MAEPSEKKATLFIINAKIQNKRLASMKLTAKKKNIAVADIFSDAVTHVITDHTDYEAALRSLKLSDHSELHGATIVTTGWFADCMNAGSVVAVKEEHKVKRPTQPEVERVETADNSPPIAEYACQRSTPLKHHNEKFTMALEILEKYADLREGDHDNSRALAFRRASCVLKSLPFPLTSMAQLQNLSFIGGHSKRIIQEILEDGESGEVESIRRDPWFHKMKLFSGVFGVGPTTAKKWIEKGWSSIGEAQQGQTSADWRQRWGLAFHDDLSTPVLRWEADHIVSVVRDIIYRLAPCASIALCGGFRRDKKTGHDVDILITDPMEGREVGLLARLIQQLNDSGHILCGKHEKSTFTDEVLYTDSKLSARGQLDHFEKWLGIFKVPKTFRESSHSDGPSETVLYSRTAEESKGEINHLSSGGGTNSTKSEQGKHAEHSEQNNTDLAGEGCTVQGAQTKSDGDNSIPTVNFSHNNEINATVSGSVDDFEPRAKRQRTCEDSGLSPSELSQQPRDWTARRVDLIVSPYSQYYYALVGWTGNKMFNRDLRWYSERKLGFKLTSHGLYNHAEGQPIPARSEREVFEHLQIPYRHPRERNC